MTDPRPPAPGPQPADPRPPAPGRRPRGLVAWWHETPLYLRILGALLLGIVVALLFSEKAGTFTLPDGSVARLPFRLPYGEYVLPALEIPARLILRLLNTLAPPLILVAIVHALMRAEFRGRSTARLVGLLVLNTLVAIMIGLFVANVVRPGHGASLAPPAKAQREPPKDAETAKVLEVLDGYNYQPVKEKPKDPLLQFLDNIPPAILEPLSVPNKVIGVIFIALAFGIALRRVATEEVRTVQDVVDVAFRTLLVVLHWIIELIPFGVFGIVAAIVGKEGFGPFASLGKFVFAVLLALLLQAAYYLLRIRFGSWVRPLQLLRGGRDALVMAFSTASSTATMPVTFARLRDRVGLRERSASMGALVGANFNNDGTALYEAMSALFISQMISHHLGLGDQFLVVLTSVAASVGAAGIPEAGLVTMTMVFAAVGLPVEYIPLLLTVDWFLDRCRTSINVMGDMNVSCLLDGKTPESAEERAAEAAAV